MSNIFRIILFPAVFEVIRLSIVLYLGEMVTNSRSLMAFFWTVNLFLFSWVGWRTWKVMEGNIKLALVATLMFSLFMLGLQLLALIIDLDHGVPISSSIFDLLLGFNIAFILFFLPLSFLFTFLGWLFSKKI